VRECLLSFGAEYFVFQFSIKNVKIMVYRTIILPVFLYGIETWSLTLREECGLSVFENMTKWGWDSSVGIVTGYGLDGLGIESR
jgi:hypothetical protein